MTIEEELKQLILSRYHSLREFTIAYDIPYTTLDSILKRGIKNSAVSNIMKICNALHISADSLANGNVIVIQEQLVVEKTKDVTDILEETKKQLLNCDGLMFDGKPADQECINSLIDALEISVEMVKRKYKFNI